MNYQETLNFLFTRRASHYKDLRRMRYLLDRLDNPQNTFPAVLITGTNGKGAVAKILSHVLTAAGFRTGCFTSPHLVDFRERITIDQQQIAEADVVRLTEQVVTQALDPFEREQKQLGIEGIAAFFELTTALAYLYFAAQQIDLAVLEVGIGGRLDATNTCNPLVSVITNVGIDHQNLLGDTIEAIAREKAAIIRENGDVVVGCQTFDSLAVIKEVCRQKSARLHRAGVQQKPGTFTVSSVIPNRLLQTGTTFSYHGFHTFYEELSMPLIGEHQLANAAIALVTIEVLGQKGFTAGKQAIRDGLAGISHHGRLETVADRPRIVVDIAHNGMGASATASTLSTVFEYQKLVLVIGVLHDKDVRGILRPFLEMTDSVVFTSPSNTSRANNAAKTASIAAEILCQADRHVSEFQHWLVCESVAEAIEQARTLAGEDDLICVTGSSYTVSEAVICIQGM
ncbi:hypothetical protein CSA56_04640 [candidate division KSB3 bacterium]|uniref:tetrahydrofolate synthase n=1 Tax=candidate division KSB3 bacterium TaxID=2044937 RepID=A0A2G6KI34_9BACT|nr:MAG: hypothetical protein CSA56_04640 [candidate division KSB3 bacterium]